MLEIYRELRNDIHEIKNTQRDMQKTQQDMQMSLADLRVLIAGNYVTKADFDDYRKEHAAHHRWLWGAVISIAGLFISIIALAIQSGGG